MKCPHCRTETLSAVTLSDGPRAWRCRGCHGDWLREADYRAWSALGSAQAADDAAEDLPVLDSREAKLCPDCGRLLIRFKVHPQVEFRLEHCGGCGGVWFDENEWDALRTQGLHADLLDYFTPAWQQELRRRELRRHLELQYRERFGEADLAKLEALRTWLAEHPRRAEILAFLSASDPYQ